MRGSSDAGSTGRPPRGGRPFAYAMPGATGVCRARERPRRRPERWARERETYPGEIVLRDLEHAPGDAALIVARFAAVRVLLLAGAGRLDPEEVRGAAGYIAVLPREHRAVLRPLLDALASPPALLPAALGRAADAAARAGHRSGAFGLLRIRYYLALELGAWTEALDAATRLAGLTARHDAPGAAARWRRRMTALRSRGRRDHGYLADMASYTEEERTRLVQALRQDAELRCPVCGAPVSSRPVAPPPEVSYVRKRVWLVCGSCGRGAAVDLPS